MDYEQIVKLISQVGFPIVVAGYLLFRMDHTLRALVEKIERLVAVIEQQAPPRP